MDGKILRVLISKLGLDGHDRGALIIAQALRDAGMEVVYGGPRNTPAMVANTALQEDVDVIGVSLLSGAHKVLIPILMEELRKNGADKIPVIIGGAIPPGDIQILKNEGIREVFATGSQLREIVDYIKSIGVITAEV